MVWHRPFPADYPPKIPVDMRATVRRVSDVRLRDNRLEWAQNLSQGHHNGGDERGNWSDNDLDGWVNQFFCEFKVHC